MKAVKGTDALKILKNRYGIDPNDKDILEAREQMMIAQMIYDARMESGLTQKELADLIGTKQSVISRLEDADYEGYSLQMLNRIAAALHKQVEIRFVSSPAIKSQQMQPTL